jgi:hypothetical protein
MLYVLCTMLYAPWFMLYALCSMLYAVGSMLNAFCFIWFSVLKAWNNSDSDQRMKKATPSPPAPALQKPAHKSLPEKACPRRPHRLATARAHWCVPAKS